VRVEQQLVLGFWVRYTSSTSFGDVFVLLIEDTTKMPYEVSLSRLEPNLPVGGVDPWGAIWVKPFEVFE